MRYLALISLTALLLAACAPASPDEQPVACTLDAKQCPDGSFVGRVGPDCAFAACPAGQASSLREYTSTSPALCATLRYTCQSDEAFSDETGCGCIRYHADPAVTTCPVAYDPVCGDNGETYSNRCMAIIDSSVAAVTAGACPPAGATRCADPRPAACTREHVPVCGNDGVTYGNKCDACTHQEVAWYVSGECDAADSFTFQPVQCEFTPWERWYNDGAITFAAEPSDAQLIAAYYTDKNVWVEAVERRDSSMAVCAACGVCPKDHSFTLRLVRGPRSVLLADGWVAP